MTRASGVTASAARSRVAFLFSPRSSNECAIDRRMYEQPRFQEVLARCDAVIGEELGWSLRDALVCDGVAWHRAFADAELEPAVTALQIATLEVWRDRGVRPDAVAGASGGEYAAAFAGGALSLEDAMRVACCTGHTFTHAGGTGAMIAVSMNRDEAEAYLTTAPQPVFLAAHYSQGNVALSGEAGAIAAVSADLSRRNVRWRRVLTRMAVHSPLMDALEEMFIERLARLTPQRAETAIYSAAAGGRVDDAPLDARHWWFVFRQPAYLADAARAIVRDGFDAFVDFGLQPVLSGAIREAAGMAGVNANLLVSGCAAGSPGIEDSVRQLRTGAEGGRTAAGRPEPSAFDPAAPDVRGDPYPHYHSLRAHGPVRFLTRVGCWAILGHAEVVEALRTPAIFSSAILRGFDAALIGADPPSHTRVRQLVTEAFTPRKMAALEAHIRARTGELLDQVAGCAAFDLVEALAMPLPVSVIAELLGMGTYDLDRLKRWSDAVVMGASGLPGLGERGHIVAAAAEMERFLADHVARLHAAPDGSLLADLVRGAGGEPLTAAEAASVARLLLIAGNETTANLIGNAVLALLRNPKELAHLQADHTLAAAAIEETLRYDAPVQMVDRITTRPVQFGGAEIPAQARVGVMIGAANRDPTVFPEPDVFSITRNPQGHLAFGGGPHYCIGSLLARLEARIVLEGLLDRLPDLYAAQSLSEVEMSRSLHLRGPRRLMLANLPTDR